MKNNVADLWASDSAKGLAFRMASYNKDADYIHGMVTREYGGGKLPTLRTIQAFINEHERSKQHAKKVAEKRGEPNELDGIDFEVGRFDLPLPRKVRDYRRWDGGISRVAIAEVEAEGKAMPVEGPFTGKALATSVARAFGLSYKDITGPSRAVKNVCARAVIAKLLRERNREVYSYPRIAKEIGRRDHSTIHNLLGIWPERCKRYPAMREVYLAMGGKDAD